MVDNDNTVVVISEAKLPTICVFFSDLQEAVEILCSITILILAGIIFCSKKATINVRVFKIVTFIALPVLILMLEVIAFDLDVKIIADFWKVSNKVLPLDPFIALAVTHAAISVVSVSALCFAMFMFWRNFGG